MTEKCHPVPFLSIGSARFTGGGDYLLFLFRNASGRMDVSSGSTRLVVAGTASS